MSNKSITPFSVFHAKDLTSLGPHIHFKIAISVLRQPPVTDKKLFGVLISQLKIFQRLQNCPILFQQILSFNSLN